ncbi:hypothetical protein J437_LFUL010019 [Ladona fulva]|uniref:AB hydrolase-1 domain-containing protein n=1 Tax=Ladona fulva TaxID=123851 RepID=A0A8K0P3I2_LADFU|nr:hypothetical protein J437_LFUL010019 [Ladona fulva]
MAAQIEAKEIRIPVPWGFIAGLTKMAQFYTLTAKAWGNPLGYPILAVHGRMDNAASFDNLAPLLPGKFLIVAIDLPGHGFSSYFPDGFSYQFMDLVLSVKRVVDHFKWESLYYIGHSIGGIIGSFFAAMYPELVKKLVMVDATKPFTFPINVLTEVLRASCEKVVEIERRVKKTVPPVYTEDEIVDLLISKRSTELSKKSAKMLLCRSLRPQGDGKFTIGSDQRMKYMVYAPLSDEQLCEILRSIQCELLLLQAKESAAFFELGGGPAVLEVFKQSCSYFQYVALDGNHDVHMDYPERVAPVVTEYLLRRKIWGDPKAPTILGVHGLQDNSSSFDRLAPMLLKPNVSFSFLAIDLPGHGLSSHFPPGRLLYLMDLVSAVYRVIDWVSLTKGKKQLFYVGHSLGGQIGLHVAALFPECIDKLVIIDALMPRPIETSRFIDYFKKNHSKLEDMEKKLEASTPPLYTYEEALEKIRARFHGNLSVEVGKVILARNSKPFGDKISFTMDQRLKFVVYPPLNELQQMTLFSKISCPVLMIVAEETVRIGRRLYAQHTKLFRFCSTSCDVYPVEGHHDVHLEHPDRVCPLICQFLFSPKSSL